MYVCMYVPSALEVLVPREQTCPSPYAVDIMRNNVSFFLRQKLLPDALPLLQRLIAIYASQVTYIHTYIYRYIQCIAVPYTYLHTVRTVIHTV
jgi:hypothetical protein